MKKAILIPIIFTSVLSLMAQTTEVAQIPFYIDAKFKQEVPWCSPKTDKISEFQILTSKSDQPLKIAA